MSSDQYSELGAGNPPIAPSQDEAPPEWPKKIRTLTASELDRLTIDGKGRFYWDGKLVNYETTPRSGHAINTADGSDLDGSAINLSNGADAADLTNQLDRTLAIGHASQRTNAWPAGLAAATVAFPERVHIKLTLWQMLGVVVVVFCLLTGTLGVAMFGFVTTVDWGCRNKLIERFCPAPSPEPRPAQRPDIPA
jgi:hypothetical protein